eukprot:6988844-Pyramimonas_sp.AAC.1
MLPPLARLAQLVRPTLRIEPERLEYLSTQFEIYDSSENAGRLAESHPGGDGSGEQQGVHQGATGRESGEDGRGGLAEEAGVREAGTGAGKEFARLGFHSRRRLLMPLGFACP